MTKRESSGPKVADVVKPILTGSWHGRDAVQQSLKVLLNILFVSFLYVVVSLLMSFDSLVLRILIGMMIVSGAILYMYFNGMNVGQGDATFSEIMYQRDAEGKIITARERDRCFHPAKGFFEALLGALPFLLVALVFAVLTQPNAYTLGALPSWLTGYTRQSGMGDVLAYYNRQSGITAFLVMKILVRSLTMPFINVAIKLGDTATLWTERLAPLWVLIAPLGYGFGYRQGLRQRIRINTGIAIGDQRKIKRQRKERRARQQSRTPDRLI